VGIVAVLGADQAGIGAVTPQHRHFGCIRVGLLQAVGEPVRHRIPEHHHGVETGGVGLGFGFFAVSKSKIIGPVERWNVQPGLT
jgi:hypothetical protein